MLMRHCPESLPELLLLPFMALTLGTRPLPFGKPLFVAWSGHSEPIIQPAIFFIKFFLADEHSSRGVVILEAWWWRTFRPWRCLRSNLFTLGRLGLCLCHLRHLRHFGISLIRSGFRGELNPPCFRDFLFDCFRRQVRRGHGGYVDPLFVCSRRRRLFQSCSPLSSIGKKVGKMTEYYKIIGQAALMGLYEANFSANLLFIPSYESHTVAIVPFSLLYESDFAVALPCLPLYEPDSALILDCYEADAAAIFLL